jgi:type IV pilus assembly protein PilB
VPKTIVMEKRRRLGDLLLEAGLVDESQLKIALADQGQWQRPLGVTLVKLGFVSETDIVAVLSEQLEIPVVHVVGKRIATEVLELVPHEIAQRRRCLPLFVGKTGQLEELYLGIADPTDIELVDDISFRTGLQVCPVLVMDGQLEEAIAANYSPRADFEDLVPLEPEDIMEPEEARDGAVAHAKPAAPKPLAPTYESELVLKAERVDPPARPQRPERPSSPQQPEPRVSAERPSPLPPPLDTHLLRALIELLVDRGVISTEELIARIQSMSAGKS